MKLIDVCNKISVWDSWLNSYKKYVPKFIEEAKHKADWKDWDDEVFKEYFERAREQCVSSLQQGYFTNNEKANIKANWGKIAPLLKNIAESQDVPLWDVYLELQKLIRSFTDSNRKAATYRMIAGLQPNLLCTVINEYNLKQVFKYIKINTEEAVPNLTNNWFQDSYNIFQLFKKSLVFTDPKELATYPWQMKVYFESGAPDQNNNDMSEDTLNDIIELLKYKKQVILQGPPGTGKTRLAKEVAAALTNPKEKVYTKDFIKERIKAGDILNGRRNTTEYIVKEIKINTILIGTNGDDREPTYDQIIESLNGKLWLKASEDRKSNTLSYADAIAKFIYSYENSNGLGDTLIKLVQFHPSYTYEDFVRGIVAVPNESGEGVVYKSEDKILGAFANLAFENYLRSKGQSKHDSTFQNKLTELTEIIRIKIDTGEEYAFGEKSTGQIIAIKEDGFLYNFPLRPEIKYKVLFDDIEKVYSVREKIKKPIDLRDIESQIGLTMKGKYPYYYMILRQLEKLDVENATLTKLSELKNFVIIIDEINRANLSSVLGELIYALEYRGEEVDSMYRLGGDGKIILPPNLYIIGTMNTADRSVGHIDYAIRRRFAFVDVLPEDLSNKLGEDFKTELFNKVAELFTERHISPEFKAKDVQLGHSYFIRQFEKDDSGDDVKGQPYDFKMRLDYEILPILKEYLNDGVFKNDPATLKKIEEIEAFQL